MRFDGIFGGSEGRPFGGDGERQERFVGRNLDGYLFGGLDDSLVEVNMESIWICKSRTLSEVSIVARRPPHPPVMAMT